MYIKPQGKKRQPLGTFSLCKQKGLITLITGCMFKTTAAHMYLILVEYIEHKCGKSTWVAEREKLLVDLGKPLQGNKQKLGL